MTLAAEALRIAAQPETPPPSPGEFCVVLVIAFTVLFFWIRGKARSSDAEARARQMPTDDRNAVQKQILEILYNSREHRMQVRHLASALNEHERYVRTLLSPLIKFGEVEVCSLADGSPDDNFNEYSTVAITADGDRRLREKDPVVMHTGDYFHAGDNANVVNKSVVINSNIGVYSAKYDSETVAALQRLESAVRETEDSDAIETLDGFLAEARSESPSKARMRVLFNGIQQLVPAISGMADVVTKVTAIFS